MCGSGMANYRRYSAIILQNLLNSFLRWRVCSPTWTQIFLPNILGIRCHWLVAIPCFITSIMICWRWLCSIMLRFCLILYVFVFRILNFVILKWDCVYVCRGRSMCFWFCFKTDFLPWLHFITLIRIFFFIIHRIEIFGTNWNIFRWFHLNTSIRQFSVIIGLLTPFYLHWFC